MMKQPIARERRPHRRTCGRLSQSRWVQSRHWFTAVIIACCATALLAVPAAWAQSRDAGGHDLTQVDLEDLGNIEVSIVSKADEPLFDAAAAVYVLTADDIERTGVTTIADALRLVPGFHVARVDAGKWAISARGFTSQYAAKLLVLLDGRSVYNPHNSGVNWDMQNINLADVDRIEVIRGPGASTWGANAVNGVVNVISKPAAQTRGTLVSSGGGTLESRFGMVRFGGVLGDVGSYRVYGRMSDRGSIGRVPNGGHHDSWDVAQGGFRLDIEQEGRDQLSIQGHLFDGTARSQWTVPSLVSATVTTDAAQTMFRGWHLLGDWKHAISERSRMNVKAYVDRSERDDVPSEFYLTTFDIDYQHRYQHAARWELSWGAGMRVHDDRMVDTEYSRFGSLDDDRSVLSAYVQESVDLVADRLQLSVGSKFEDHTYTGFNVQPNARLSWQPLESHTLWTSVSRAIRTPGRNERSGIFAVALLPPSALGEDNHLSVLTTIEPDSGFGNEELIAYEFGWRTAITQNAHTDVALFYNEYDQLRSVEYGTPTTIGDPPTHFVLPVHLRNGGTGKSYGLELASTWDITRQWSVSATYSFFRLFIDAPKSRAGDEFFHLSHVTPRHIATMRWSWSPAAVVDLDGVVRYQDAVRQGNLPAFTELDVRVAVRPFHSLEAEVVGRDLLQPRHREADYGLTVQETAVERSAYAGLKWRF
ncbi:MAG: TonB-dependent receptor [candidate division Zixibacteria bacterium]|nr:TonB-dependent receptor [candidate division Zixibacteria bacterium]